MAGCTGSCTRRAIDYWLFGGWAVDFHAGKVTRRHADIDVAVWQADFEHIDGVLGEDGWTRRAQPGEEGYTEYENGVHRLDLAFLVRDEEGVVYTPLSRVVALGPPAPSAMT